jgi:hypothetical protein
VNTEIADTFRPSSMVRRFKRGTGMVTPRAPVRNGLETLQPGRDRLAPDAEAVLQQPDMFVPCDRADEVTAERMRSLTRSRTRPRGRGQWKLPRESAADDWGLGPSSEPASWRLP